MIELKKFYLQQVVLSLCTLITGEVDNHGTKRRVRRWVKSLREIVQQWAEVEEVPLIDEIRAVEREAEAYLFLPKIINDGGQG